MARAQLVTVSVLIGAALGAAIMLFTPSPRESALEMRIADLESDLAAAKRETSDSERVASRERERNQAAEEEVERLRHALAHPPETPSGDDPAMGGGMAGGGGHGGASDRSENDILAPKNWDDRRLRTEIQLLAMSGRRMGSSPRLAACVEAARAHGDSAFALLIGILRQPQMPESVRRAATLILEQLGDERAVRTLLGAWEISTEFDEQRLLLRALANLPGAEQTHVFVAV